MGSTAKEQVEARCKFMLIQVFLFILSLSLWLTGPKNIIGNEPFTATEQVAFSATQLSTPSVTDQNLDKQCKLQLGVWKIQIIIYIYIYISHIFQCREWKKYCIFKIHKSLYIFQRSLVWTEKFNLKHGCCSVSYPVIDFPFPFEKSVAFSVLFVFSSM